MQNASTIYAFTHFRYRIGMGTHLDPVEQVAAVRRLIVLAPSQRDCQERGLRHKTLIDWARQIALQARRWLPGREIVLLGAAALRFWICWWR